MKILVFFADLLMLPGKEYQIVLVETVEEATESYYLFLRFV